MSASSPTIDTSTWSPRDRARHGGARALVRLASYLLVLGGVELVAAVVDAATEPELPPAFLVTLGLVARAALGLGLVWILRELGPWGRALGIGTWVVGASILALLSTALTAVRLAEVAPPTTVPVEVWDPLVRLVAGIFYVGALVTTLLVTARLAKREGLEETGRALAWSGLPLVGALLASLVVLEPALLPSWWLGAAAPLATLVILALVGIITWDRALWPVLFAGLFGGLLLVMEVSPTIVAGLAAVLGIILAAVMPRGPLYDVATVLGEEPAAAPSRTFIRRLLDGPTESQVGSSRIGSQPDGVDEEAANLALAYRELGIEPPRPKVAPAPAPQPGAAEASTEPAPAASAELPPLGPMAKFEPVPTGRTTRPASKAVPRPAAEARSEVPEAPAPPAPPAPIALAIADVGPWGLAADSLHQMFRGFVGRTCTLVFGFMLIRTPLANEVWTRLGAFTILATLTAFMALGLMAFSNHVPVPALRRTARWGAALIGLTAALDAAIGVALVTSPALAGPLAIIDGALFVFALALVLGLLRALFAHLGQPNARGRVTVLGLELLVFTGLLAMTVVTSQSPDSDTAWLAFPTGIGAALAGLAFFATFLWLITDARTLIADWQTRIRRAHAPEARE